MRFKNRNQIYSKFQKNVDLGFFKRIFFLTSLLYFFILFFKNFSQISFSINFELNRYDFFLSFVVCILSIYLNAFAWKNIVRWFGIENIKNNLVSFYVLTNILKYIPGGIWHFVERFNFVKNYGNTQVAFYSTLIEPYLMLCSSFLLASIGVIYSPFFLLLIIPILFLNRKLLYLALIGLGFLKGKASEAMKLPNPNLNFVKSINLISFFPIRAFLYEIGFVITKFIGFLICFNLVNSDKNIDIIFLFVAFCFSWTIGLIVPTAPSGVGVFEACFLFLMGRYFPQNLIILSLIYFRLVSTTSDLFLSFPFLLKSIMKRI